jgi:hypothetical protein
VPFVTFSAAQIIEKMLKHKVLLILMVIFAVVFALKIEDWKTQQDLSNLFRYNMAKSVSHYFIPYDTLDVNPGSYIDPDLYVYDFYQNLRFVPSPVKNLKDLKNANFYVYSCIGCNLNNPEVNFLAQKFKYETHISPPGTVYIFFLKQKQTEKIPQAQISKAIGVPAGTVPEKQSLPRRIYTFLMNFLQVPQI